VTGRVLPFERPASGSPEGKLPPQDVRAEAALLTTCIWKPEYVAEVFSVATPEDFYFRGHQVIAEALLWLASNNQPIDEVSVETRMRDAGTFQIVGVGFVAGMMDQVALVAHPKRQAETVRDKAVLRRFAFDLHRLWAECYEPQESPRGLLEQAEAVARAHMQVLGRGAGTSLLDVAKSMARERAAPAAPTTPTGFPWLDEQLTGGFRAGQLFYVGARPGTGKSVLAGQMAVSALNAGKRVVYVTLEMSAAEMLERLSCSFMGISYGRVSRGDPSLLSEFNVGVKELVTCKRLEIVDAPAMSVLDVEAAAVARKADVVFVDYLQLLQEAKGSKGSQRSREQAVSEMSRALKTLALRLKIPVIALCQLSRASARDSRRPVMSDLRESGSLEQDADGVLFLWRPQYENPDADPDARLQGELIVGKLRRGQFGQAQRIKLTSSGFREEHA
jgi:replicative DNA helicase